MVLLLAKTGELGPPSFHVHMRVCGLIAFDLFCSGSTRHLTRFHESLFQADDIVKQVLMLGSICRCKKPRVPLAVGRGPNCYPPIHAICPDLLRFPFSGKGNKRSTPPFLHARTVERTPLWQGSKTRIVMGIWMFSEPQKTLVGALLSFGRRPPLAHSFAALAAAGWDFGAICWIQIGPQFPTTGVSFLATESKP